MSDVVDTVVIGAGVVGLAVARELASQGREVIVLEKNSAIGEETSARNSEVIHAGIYYPPGSLKARLCVDGRRRLYAYCEEKGIAHRRCGKLIVAVHDAQRPKLDALRRASAANGTTDLEALDARGIEALEPAVRGVAALWSPSTGIVDSHALMLAYRGDLERAGGSVALRARCTAAARDGDFMRLSCDVDGVVTELHARAVVNAAGLHALDLARLIAQPGLALPPPRFAKGNYFVCGGKSPFTHLVYPVPEDGGSAFTLRLARRPHALRAERRVAPRGHASGGARLRRRRAPRDGVLRGDQDVLARDSGRQPRARVLRRATEDQRSGRAGCGLRDSCADGAGRAARRTALRDRVAGAHRVARHRGARRGVARYARVKR